MDKQTDHILWTTIKRQSRHIGRKISRIRELRGIKQDALATDLGISQQTISKIEQSETVDDKTLEKVAKVLGVEKEAIKNFSEEGVFNYFNNPNFNDNSIADVNSNNNQCTFNPLDKVVELYERLLQSEKEKVELLKGKVILNK